jgi:hypothetical protein
VSRIAKSFLFYLGYVVFVVSQLMHCKHEHLFDNLFSLPKKEASKEGLECDKDFLILRKEFNKRYKFVDLLPIKSSVL